MPLDLAYEGTHSQPTSPTRTSSSFTTPLLSQPAGGFPMQKRNGEKTYQAVRDSGSYTFSSRKDRRWNILVAVLVGGAGVAGWLMGRTPSVEMLGSSSGGRNSRCNPYAQRGYLKFNPTEAKENYWQSLNPDPECQAVDYMSLFAAEGDPSPLMDFAWNRTVVLFGDSVDRINTLAFCHYAGGHLEAIGPSHILSPVSPPPPPGYINHYTNATEWAVTDQSRPFVCSIPKYNFVLVNAFHYGLRDTDEFIMHHGHFYAPGKWEDRLDLIVIPILEKLSTLFDRPLVPDMISITTGFWGLLRKVAEDDAEAARLRSIDPRDPKIDLLDPWTTLTPDVVAWQEKRIREVILHTANAFEGARRRPKIVWRGLHHIKEHRNMPYGRIATLDSIARHVVDELVAEEASEKAGWRGAKEQSLGSRLEILEWGSLMMGQENHFYDNSHPMPLPGGLLYAQMVMEQLRRWVDDE